MENDIVIYTDGGCSGNPGPGGWGSVIIYDGNEIKLSGGEHLTTNNRMELMAAIAALQFISDNDLLQRPVSVFSDSQYVKNGITTWIKGWKMKGWKTADKKPVKNQDLWMKLDELYNSVPNLEWKWVKGHAGVKYNEMCDQLAGMEIEKNR